MPLPTARDVHAVDQPLTDQSVAIIQSEADFGVPAEIFPTVAVDKESDKYYIFDQGDFARTDVLQRGVSDVAAELGFRLSEQSYFSQAFGGRVPLSRRVTANADAALQNLDAAAVRRITMDILIKRQKDWVTAFFGTSLWTGSTTGSDITVASQWNNDESTPIEDVRAQFFGVQGKTGFRPNTMIVDALVHQELLDHPDIIARIQHTQAGFLTEQILAQAFGVERYVVLWPIENTATEGATDVFARISGKHAALLYVTPSSGLMVPSAGYNFAWSPFGNDLGVAFRRYTVEERGMAGTEYIEGNINYDFKLVSAVLGAFFSSVVA